MKNLIMKNLIINSSLALLFAVMANFALIGAGTKTETATKVETKDGAKVFDQTIEFLTMEKRHMDDWFDFKIRHNDEEKKLHKKKFDTFVDFKLGKLKEVKNKGFSTKLMHESLKEMIELHEKGNKEMEDFYRAECKKGEELNAKHQKELAAFKKSVLP